MIKKKADAKELFEKLGSLHISTKFTTEYEVDSKLPFLDLSWLSDGKLRILSH